MMTLLLKETTEARILRIADSLQPEIRRTFLNAITELKRQVPIGRITDLLEEGELSGVLEALSEVSLTPQQLAPINDAILQTVTLSAELTVAEFGLDFALVNERAVRYASETAGRLIVGIDSTTTEAVADIVSRSLREGVAPRSQARLIQQIVGLTPRDALAVDRFKTGMLSDGVREALAGDRAERMARRLLLRRAENIARTETIRASNMGTQLGWDAASDAGLLPPGTQKVWIATEDSRTCPICAVLDGKVVALGGNFDVSEEATAFTIVGDEIKVTATRALKRPSTTRTPPAHPSCRCTIGLELVASETTVQSDLAQTNGVAYDPTDIRAARKQREAFLDNWLETAPSDAIRDRRKQLVSSIESWTGADWDRVRADIKRGMKSGVRPTGPNGALFDALSATGPDAPALFRGEAIPRSRTARLEWLSKRLVPGDKWDMDLASFTSDQAQVVHHAPTAKNQVSVIWELKSESHAMNLEWASRKSTEKEWLTMGRFRTVSAERLDTQSGFERWVVQIEQVGDVAKARPAWMPADWNPEHTNEHFQSFAARRRT